MPQIVNWLLVMVVIAASVSDYRNQKIPNKLNLPSLLIALVVWTCLDGWSGLFFGLKGFLMGFALLILPYLMGVMGGGDVKLMSVVGAFIGVKGVLNVFLLTSLCGGAYAIVLILSRPAQFKGFFRQQWVTAKLFVMTKKFIPDKPVAIRPRLYYGIAIAAGTLLFLLLDMAGFEPFI